ncbi:MAG: hypothetical protein OXL68_05375 [Paracoccaceae bacterium]|nr:hypothetical protein [Paracoccaceae bacterium]
MPTRLDVMFRATPCALGPTQQQDMRMAQADSVCRLVRNLSLEQRRPWAEHPDPNRIEGASSRLPSTKRRLVRVTVDMPLTTRSAISASEAP